MSSAELTNATQGEQSIDLMALLGRCLGNIKMVERVLATFRATGKSDLDQLQQAIETSDFQAISEISHRFGGSASNISALKLRELLTQTERLGREQNTAELMAVLVRLQSEWEGFERYSRAFAPTAGHVAPGATRLSHSPSGTSYAGASC
jgi:HPt (histidine-containing phosphotransfer) domain-containing protein